MLNFLIVLIAAINFCKSHGNHILTHIVRYK